MHPAQQCIYVYEKDGRIVPHGAPSLLRFHKADGTTRMVPLTSSHLVKLQVQHWKHYASRQLARKRGTELEQRNFGTLLREDVHGLVEDVLDALRNDVVLWIYILRDGSIGAILALGINLVSTTPRTVLQAFMVNPALHGTGIGNCFMSTIEADHKQKQICTEFCVVASVRSSGFWRKCGYDNMTEDELEGVYRQPGMEYMKKLLY